MWTSVLFCCFGLLVSAWSLDLDNCNSALGMENGAISDEKISSSSSYDHDNVGPHRGRIRQDERGGAWCPERQIEEGVYEYLEIDFDKLYVISQVETQGRFGNGQGAEYAEFYRLQYQRENATDEWKTWTSRSGDSIIRGNSNTYLGEKRSLDPPILAHRIRFVPHSEYARTICMRVEAFGCEFNDAIVWYSMPQGDSRDSSVQFYDTIYDGFQKDNRLYLGVGQLVDGVFGEESIYNSPLSQTVPEFHWVGWRNDSVVSRDPIDITFKFDQVRRFRSVTIQVSNLVAKEVGVFRASTFQFSVGGKYYLDDPLEFDTAEMYGIPKGREPLFPASKTSLNITFPLYAKVAQFIKVHLWFSKQWMLIGEVEFNSEPVLEDESFTEEEPILKINPPMVPIGLMDEELNENVVDEFTTTTPMNTTLNSSNDAQATQQLIFIMVIVAICAFFVILLAVCTIVKLRNRKYLPGRKHSKLHTDLLFHFEKPSPFDMSPNFHINPTVYGSDTSHSDIVANEAVGEIIYQEPNESIMMTARGEFTDRDYETLQEALPLPPPLPLLPPVPVRMTPLMNVRRCHNSPTSTLASTCAVSPRPQTTCLDCQTSTLVVDNGFATASTHRCFDREMSIDGKLSQSSMGSSSSGSCRKGLFNVSEFPRDKLEFVEKLGGGNFGEVHLCAIRSEVVEREEERKFVAVKLLKRKEARDAFEQEIEIAASLNDPNIVRVLGVCSEQEPLAMVVEYMKYGDLSSFLQRHTLQEDESGKQLITLPQLLFMARQISSGMKYFESMNYVHRDLATRNCLVGEDLRVKISDFGMSRHLFASDYYRVEGKALLPIRWMAWESILLGKFSSKSDVWSFGVTLWELLTLAQQRPFPNLSDSQVISNAGHVYHKNEHERIMLARPVICPKEVYQILCQCWNREEEMRPNFAQICEFLEKFVC